MYNKIKLFKEYINEYLSEYKDRFSFLDNAKESDGMYLYLQNYLVLQCNKECNELVNGKDNVDDYNVMCSLLEHWLKLNFLKFKQTSEVYRWCKDICLERNELYNKWRMSGWYDNFENWYNNKRTNKELDKYGHTFGLYYLKTIWLS